MFCLSGVSVLRVADLEEREEVEAADLALVPVPGFPAPFFLGLVTGVNIFLCVVLVGVLVVVLPVILLFSFRDWVVRD